MEQTECSETLANKIQTPGNYPEESIQHSEHGKSLKSRILRSLVGCLQKKEVRVNINMSKVYIHLSLQIAAIAIHRHATYFNKILSTCPTHSMYKFIQSSK